MRRYAAAAILLTLPFPAFAQAPAPIRTAYDGTWSVTLICPTAPDGAFGYTYRFPAYVASGVLHGENGTAGSSGWLALDGPIGADGTANLLARGLIGSSAYAVGGAQKLTPYSYHVAARFTPTQGTGNRVEARPCSVQFMKS